MKQLAKRIYQSDPWGTAPRWFIESYPQVIERLAARIRPSDPFVYRPRPTVGVAASPFIVDPIHAGASTEKIRRVLGYSPAVAREQAMALTLEWARAARIVPEAVPERVLTAVSS